MGIYESTIDSEGFKGGTRGAPIMPRDAVSRTANVGTVGKNGTRVGGGIPAINKIYNIYCRISKIFESIY